MIRSVLFVFLWGSLISLQGCGETHRFEEYVHEGGGGADSFQRDASICEAEKDKHSHKIQGREFGFTGSQTGFLGCMKIKGWERKK